MKPFGVSGATIAAAFEVGRRSFSSAAKALSDSFGHKLNKTSSSCSELRKFFSYTDQSRSENALLISKFIKINTGRSPGTKKDKIWEQNLQTLVRGKTNTGFQEVSKILTPEFSQGPIKERGDSDSLYGTDNTKGKTSQKTSQKRKSSKK
ncbi:hypothetical protein L6164_027502 [Bauhinia variegata]|uniref:Uncharacterized protein n=1 Tax=Bauhinia variegata TaxID=167791 RepID=A0ACB9LUS5_BAUVA|nr:hypothetical protein L6164_027502 [Bauhinia variegata]